MYRKALLFLTATIVVGGCSCGEPPPAEYSVQILSPLDGQILRAADDTDPATPGLQIDVQVHTSGFAQIDSATLQVDGVETGLAMQPGENGNFSFTGLSLEAGPRVLTVYAAGRAADGDAAISDVGLAQITVDFASGDPGLKIVSPAEGVLNAASDADPDSEGLQTSVEVSLAAAREGVLTLCSTVAAPVDAAACDKSPGRVVTTAAIAGETAQQFALALPEGTVDLTAEFRDGLTAEVYSSATVSWTIDTEAPTLEFMAPAPGAVVVQNPVPVMLRTDAEPGQIVTISGGAEPVTGEVDDSGLVLAEVDADEGTVVLTASVTDRAGNPAAPAQVTFTVDTIACELTLVSPSDSVVFYNGSHDKDPATPGLQVDLVARTGDCKDGQADLYVAGVKVASAHADPLTGEFVFEDVTFADGSQNVPVTIELLDEGGNLAKLDFSISVMLAGPELVLFADGGTRNLLNDRDYATPGVQIQAAVEASAVQGGTITLCSTVEPSPGAAACRTGGFRLVDPPVAHIGLQSVFPRVSLADGAQEIFAEVVDEAGNVSTSPRAALVVDSIAPRVTSLILVEDAGSDGLISATELPAGQPATFELAVAGAEGQTISLLTSDGAGPAIGSGVISSGLATIQAPLADGTHQLLARVVSATGNPNVSASPLILNPEARLSIVVDRVPPQLSLVGPPSVLNKSHDTVNPSTNALETTIEVSTDLADGRTVQFVIDGGTAQLATVSQGRAQLPVTFSQGAHTVEVTAVDLVGNETRQTFQFTVDTLAPTLAFSSPTPGQIIHDYAVPVVLDTNAEPGQVVTVTASGATGQSWTAEVDASGKAILDLTLINGTHTLTANVSDAAGNPATPATVEVTVNAAGCQIAFVSPATNPARFGASADKDGNPANGLQVDIVASTANCAGIDAVLLVDGVEAGTVTAGAGGEIVFGDVTFADGATNVPVTVRMTDINDETNTASTSVSVKLTSPAMTLSPARPAGGVLTYVAETNPNADGVSIIKDLVAGGDADAELGVVVNGARNGRLTLTLGGSDLIPPRTIASDTENFGGPLGLRFAQGTDADLVVTVTDAFGNTVSETYRVVVDVQPPAAPTVTATLADSRAARVDLAWTSTGDDGNDGTLAGYDIRYLTSTAAGQSLTCPALDETTFDGSAVVKVASPPPAGAPGQPVAFALEGLPPLNCYAIAVRAVDEVGNLSPLTNVVHQQNAWNELATVDGNGGAFGALMRSGDFDGDGIADLAVAANVEGNGTGAVYVYYGGANPGARMVKLEPLGASERFGISIAVGDFSGDGIDDLAVGAFGFGGASGRAYLYFGRSGAQLDAAEPVRIHGRVAGGGLGFSLGVVGDVDGDGTAELAIGARKDGVGGSVFLFEGKPEADWRTDASAGGGQISAASAWRTFSVTTAGEDFGIREGYAALGDLDGDGKGEIGIPASLGTKNRYYVFDGATVFAAASRTLTEADATILSRPPASTANTFGFGTSAIGGRDLDGDGFPDLVISDPMRNQVHYYSGDPASGAIGPLIHTLTQPVAANTYFGASLASVDLDGDGQLDLLVGNNSATPSEPGGSSIYLFFNMPGGAPFSALGSLLKIGSASSTIEAADFNGDGLPDLAIADGSGNGKVRFYGP